MSQIRKRAIVEIEVVTSFWWKPKYIPVVLGFQDPHLSTGKLHTDSAAMTNEVTVVLPPPAASKGSRLQQGGVDSTLWNGQRTTREIYLPSQKEWIPATRNHRPSRGGMRRCKACLKCMSTTIWRQNQKSSIEKPDTNVEKRCVYGNEPPTILWTVVEKYTRGEDQSVIIAQEKFVHKLSKIKIMQEMWENVTQRL